MHTLTSTPSAADDTPAALAPPAKLAAPWIAIAGVAAALALVAWAGPRHGEAAGAATALECRISHPAGTGSPTTVMLVNASPHTLPAGTEWAWSPAGGAPEHGERHVLSAPLVGGGAVRVPSAVPAVALRCRAALLGALPVAVAEPAAAAGAVASVAAVDAGLSPR